MCHRFKDIKNELIIRIWLPPERALQEEVPIDHKDSLNTNQSIEHKSSDISNPYKNGHISLEIPKNNIYASFWPLSREKFSCQACQLFQTYLKHSNKVDTNIVEKYMYDKYFAGYRLSEPYGKKYRLSEPYGKEYQHCKEWIPKEPDSVFKFYSLDIDKITQQYLKFRKRIAKEYEICSNEHHSIYNCGFRYIECSDVIYKFLQNGGLDNLFEYGDEYGQKMIDMHMILSTPKTFNYFLNAINCLEQIYFRKQMNKEIIDDKATRMWFAKLTLAKREISKDVIIEIEHFKQMTVLHEMIRKSKL
jgi:hypothetical protein